SLHRPDGEPPAATPGRRRARAQVHQDRAQWRIRVCLDGGDSRGARMTALRTLRLWPRTLFARLMVILLVGLALAQGLAFSLVLHERADAADRLMLGNLETDVASSVAML